MRVLAIDPGTEQSGYVVYEDGIVREAQIATNEVMLSVVELWRCAGDTTLAVEWVESYGMPVGREVFETVLWVGRFVERWGGNFERIPRRAVKLALCGSPRAKDTNVRQALIDRFGGSRGAAIGTKKNQGPLYGITSHMMSALAVAVTLEQQKGIEG